MPTSVLRASVGGTIGRPLTGWLYIIADESSTQDTAVLLSPQRRCSGRAAISSGEAGTPGGWNSYPPHPPVPPPPPANSWLRHWHLLNKDIIISCYLLYCRWTATARWLSRGRRWRARVVAPRSCCSWVCSRCSSGPSATWRIRAVDPCPEAWRTASTTSSSWALALRAQS